MGATKKKRKKQRGQQREKSVNNSKKETGEKSKEERIEAKEELKYKMNEGTNWSREESAAEAEDKLTEELKEKQVVEKDKEPEEEKNSGKTEVLEEEHGEKPEDREDASEEPNTKIENLGEEPADEFKEKKEEEKGRESGEEENPEELNREIESSEGKTAKDLEEKMVDEPVEEPAEKESSEEVNKKPEEETNIGLKEVPAEESTEESIEEENKQKEADEKKTAERKKRRKKILIGSAISLCILLAFYFGMTRYFAKHFYFGSEINSIDVSGKTVEDAKMAMALQLQDYKLDLKERGGNIEQIQGNEIGLKYASEEEIRELKEKQNPFKWILAWFNTKDSKITLGVSYDEGLLKEKIDTLSCLNSSNIVEPKNPGFQYTGSGYEIVPEVLGNKVNKEVLYSRIVDAMVKKKTEIDLNSAGCYITPKYTSKSKKTIEVKDTLNKYVSSKISYTLGDKSEKVDGSTINKWLSVDDNFEVKIDENMIKDYIYKLSQTYNTVGQTRTFVTSSGTTINVRGGDYGWAINKTREIQNLIKEIKEGKTIMKEPEYVQKGFTGSYSSNDIGNTYVEISIARQRVWFYKNGELVVQGNVVTGNVSADHSTPTGVYWIKYKQMNTVLKGPGYAVPVTYWMPFNQGVGLHDANWRYSFGGSIYLTNGSHGCVNMPFNIAREIYINISAKTPVVCY